MFGEEGKVFSMHTTLDVIADHFLDMGLPEGVVKGETVQSIITLCEGVRASSPSSRIGARVRP